MRLREAQRFIRPWTCQIGASSGTVSLPHRRPGRALRGECAETPGRTAVIAQQLRLLRHATQRGMDGHVMGKQGLTMLDRMSDAAGK